MLRLGVIVALTVASLASAQSYRVLKSFTFPDGANPRGGLVLSGNTLYGTTSSGGILNLNYGGVFKMNTDGTGYTVLKNFSGPEGANPIGRLVLSGTTLYGTTGGGGVCYDVSGMGRYCCGVVFRVNTDGSGYTVLKGFSGSDGMGPFGGMVLSGTTLYGTTQQGGSSFNLPNNFGGGVVFKVNTDGSGYTVLKNYPWPGNSDGAWPVGGLVLSGTTLYGTTHGGGGAADGVVFKMNTDGSGYTVLKSFTGWDGVAPMGDLVLAGSALYGTTSAGGLYWYSNAAGVVFKVNTDGSGYTVLRNFSAAEGYNPVAGLVLSGSTLYGTTEDGGGSYNPPANWGYGMIFKVNTDGSDYAVLKNFNGTSEGRNSCGTLVMAGNTLYGTTENAGTWGRGVIFSGERLSITTQPLTQTAEAESMVELRVRATGFAALSYQWFFNETNILVNGTSPSLELTNVQAAQAGAYTVVVTNLPEGAITSAPALLSVTPSVQRKIVPALVLTGQPGSSLNIEDTEALGPSPAWLTFGSLELTNTTQWYFDLSEPLSPQRFYRAWQTAPAPSPMLDIHFVPAITLFGTIGKSVRVDGINQSGPTDAWFTLDTVTLTNTSQLYFDTSAIGQPARLYRLVPVP